MGAVRVSDHTRAFVRGSPVCESHTTVVSRWFVIPIAARSEMSFPCDTKILVATEMHFVMDVIISFGSCSSQL